jgi:hypothetical protein
MKLALACTGTVLSFLLCACTTTSDSGATIQPGTVSTGPSRPPRPGSSSSSSTSGGFDDPDEPSDEWGCPQDVPLTEADLDKEIGWKPGAPAPGSCTDADLQAIAANFTDTSIKTYFDLAKGVTDTCRACVVSKDTDAKWGPIVGTAENDGETGFVNYGACFGAIEGDACGKAIQYQTFCENIACNECAVSTKERADCIALASNPNAMCEPFTKKRTTACPSWTLNVKSCGEVQTAIKTLCGSPS